MHKSIGKNIRRLRTARQLTQAQLGERAKCGQATVSKLENDQNPAVGLAVLGRISDALSVALVDLMKG
jgi:transcriptional regulator with XRE-family HTH domain